MLRMPTMPCYHRATRHQSIAMSTRSAFRSCCAKQIPVLWLLLALLFYGAVALRAQTVETLVQFTNVWKFDQSGLELGTAWRTNDYDDSAWPSGRGLLGFENNPQSYAVHAPFSTPLTVSSSVTTFYFRATFELTGSTAGLTLIASNLVDDGCVIYLNGLRAGSVRAPATYNATTLFSGPASEGQIDSMTLANFGLRQGDNVLAVEVHQSSPVSEDVVWGMRLMAIRPTVLAITNPPQSQTVLVGDSITLSVGVMGGPAFYRWFKDGMAIPNATNSSYLVSNALLSSAGQYQVIITNSINAVTSIVAMVTVLPDRAGPTMIVAIVNNRIPGSAGSFGSNTINVLFNETIHFTAARNTDNYFLRQPGSTNDVPILRALYSSELGALLNVDTTDPDWVPGGDLVLTVNGVKDLHGNVIAPDSQIAVAWSYPTNLLGADAAWSVHSAATSEPDIYEQPWNATNFMESLSWRQGQGAFCGGTLGGPPCVEDCQSDIGYQSEPTLFRTTFAWPGEFGSRATLNIAASFDDALALYLNGREIFRANLPAGERSITSATKAINRVTVPICDTNILILITNLLPGTNWLCAAVVQSAVLVGDADIVFGLRLNAIALVAPSIPPGVAPTLNISSLDATAVLLSWAGHGYALESSTNLSLGPVGYPFGPWLQVSNMSNPFTNSLSKPARFFRLRK